MMILATYVALEMFHGLNFATAGLATERGIRAINCATVVTRSAVIAQQRKAVAPHTAPFAKEFPLRTTVAKGILALLALLNRARRGWLNVTHQRWRQGGVTAPRLLGAQ